MNIYEVKLSSRTPDDCGYTVKKIGYSSATSEYLALKAIGFINPKLLGACMDSNGRDTWSYGADNIANLTIHISKL